MLHTGQASINVRHVDLEVIVSRTRHRLVCIRAIEVCFVDCTLIKFVEAICEGMFLVEVEGAV